MVMNEVDEIIKKAEEIRNQVKEGATLLDCGDVCELDIVNDLDDYIILLECIDNYNVLINKPKKKIPITLETMRKRFKESKSLNVKLNDTYIITVDWDSDAIYYFLGDKKCTLTYNKMMEEGWLFQNDDIAWEEVDSE